MRAENQRWRSTSMDHERSGLVSIDREPERKTLRNFGLALALLCVVRGVWSAIALDPTYTSKSAAVRAINSAYQTAAVTGCVGLALACIALLRPSMFHRPYVLLGVLSFPLRWLLSYLVLALVYFAVITPVACGVRIVRKLQARDARDARDETPHSHWRHSPPRGDKTSYFRQF
jgi:hypothetical protein